MAATNSSNRIVGRLKGQRPNPSLLYREGRRLTRTGVLTTVDVLLGHARDGFGGVTRAVPFEPVSLGRSKIVLKQEGVRT